MSLNLNKNILFKRSLKCHSPEGAFLSKVKSKQFPVPSLARKISKSFKAIKNRSKLKGTDMQF